MWLLWVVIVGAFAREVQIPHARSCLKSNWLNGSTLQTPRFQKPTADGLMAFFHISIGESPIFKLHQQSSTGFEGLI
jgi:hypothetical protein